MDTKIVELLLNDTFLNKFIINEDEFILFLSNDYKDDISIKNFFLPFRGLRLVLRECWLGNKKDFCTEKIYEEKSLLAHKLTEFVLENNIILSVNVIKNVTLLEFENNKILAINNLSDWFIDNKIEGDYFSDLRYIIECNNGDFSINTEKITITDKIETLKKEGTPNDLIISFLNLEESKFW